MKMRCRLLRAGTTARGTAGWGGARYRQKGSSALSASCLAGVSGSLPTFPANPTSFGAGASSIPSQPNDVPPALRSHIDGPPHLCRWLPTCMCQILHWGKSKVRAQPCTTTPQRLSIRNSGRPETIHRPMPSKTTPKTATIDDAAARTCVRESPINPAEINLVLKIVKGETQVRMPRAQSMMLASGIRAAPRPMLRSFPLPRAPTHPITGSPHGPRHDKTLHEKHTLPSVPFASQLMSNARSL